jgi:hypothetical protein
MEILDEDFELSEVYGDPEDRLAPPLEIVTDWPSSKEEV